MKEDPEDVIEEETGEKKSRHFETWQPAGDKDQKPAVQCSAECKDQKAAGFKDQKSAEDNLKGSKLAVCRG